MEDVAKLNPAERGAEAPAPFKTMSSPADRAAWDEIYAVSENVFPSLSSRWASAVTGSGFRDRSRYYEFPDGTRAVMPMFAGGLGLGQASPPPAWGFGGVIASKPLGVGQLRSILDDVARSGPVITTIRPSPLEHELWDRAADARWKRVPRSAHIVRLKCTFEEFFSKKLSSSTRNKIRRAERANLELEAGNSEKLVSEFHGLLRIAFERFARKQNEPVFLTRWRGLRRDPEAKFQAMAKAMGPIMKIWMARKEGQPVAAALVLRDREAHYTRNAMNEDLVGDSYANYLIQTRAIEEACKAGCGFYNMGESGTSKSLAAFKGYFGGEPFDYFEYRYERLPITETDRALRTLVKKAIGFKEN